MRLHRTSSGFVSENNNTASGMAATAPNSRARMKAGTSEGEIPAKVSNSERAIVIAGIHALQYLERQRVNLTLRITSGTKGMEPTAAPVIKERLGEDAARGVAGAQKKDVVGPEWLHSSPGCFVTVVYRERRSSLDTRDANSRVDWMAGGACDRSRRCYPSSNRPDHSLP